MPIPHLLCLLCMAFDLLSFLLHLPKLQLMDYSILPLICLFRYALSRRIPDEQSLRTELKALEDECNAKASSVNWRFTTDDARIKLKRLYPSFCD